MKKIFIFAIATLIVVGCSKNKNVSEADIAQNIISYIKEKGQKDLADEISTIDIIGEEIVVGDTLLELGKADFARAGFNYLKKKITKSEYQHIVDSTECAMKDAQAWITDDTTDSLLSLKKYEECLRKVYTTMATMKDGTTAEARVIMCSDGVTPKMFEGEYCEHIDGYIFLIKTARERLEIE